MLDCVRGGAMVHLHTISMVNIDVNVQHPLMVLEQLQDGKDNVVDVAEATGLGLLGMV